MTNYYLKVRAPFIDKETERQVHMGDIFVTTDYDRARDILRRKLATLKGIMHGGKDKPIKVLIHQKLCYKIGGIETANRQLAEAFKDEDMTFVFGDADQDQLMHLSRYHDVWIDDSTDHYKTDVLIMTNYDSAPAILDRIEARKVYQQIHADFDALTQMKEWSSFVWKPSPRIDKVLSVSETAQKGLKKRFGVDSVVAPNILSDPPKERPMVFLNLSRATPEKGIDRLVKLLKRFDEADKDYILFSCSTIEQANDSDETYLKENPRVVSVKPTVYSRELIRASDYLIQLSYNESYCYSVREALQVGVPCIVSDIPELRKLITPGKNGYIYSDDFDVELLWKTHPKFEPYREKVPAIWEKVLRGTL